MKSIYTVKFYSAIKKIYTVAFVAEWIELDRCIKGNEPDSEKNKHCIIPFMQRLDSNLYVCAPIYNVMELER